LLLPNDGDKTKSRIMKCYSLLFSLLFLLIACQSSGSKSDMRSLDLLKYGIPMTIMAPDSVAVKSGSLSFSKDVTIKGEESGFDIQIFAYDATSMDTEVVKKEQLEQIKDNPYFSKIVQEDPNGFIYEIALDSTSTNYGFKYMRVQGDKEYIFQNGMTGSFSLEEATTMYEAVQQN